MWKAKVGFSSPSFFFSQIPPPPPPSDLEVKLREEGGGRGGGRETLIRYGSLGRGGEEEGESGLKKKREKKQVQKSTLDAR